MLMTEKKEVLENWMMASSSTAGLSASASGITKGDDADRVMNALTSAVQWRGSESIHKVCHPVLTQKTLLQHCF